ncbi:hypothetical protein BJ742DRAFT_776460 [Cladochytrium replicatum]|nr:hypothetical protein BJ742DRAFT_776460 [Cladochytrium replicatum]
MPTGTGTRDSVVAHLRDDDLAGLTADEKRAKLASEFHRAASNGDVAKVRDLLTHHRELIDIDSKDDDGTSALIYAACFGHVDICYLLLQNDAVVDQADKHGWTALMWAVSVGNADIARLLVDGGAKKDVKSNTGRTIKNLVNRSAPNAEISQILDYEPASADKESSSSWWDNASSSDESPADSEPNYSRSPSRAVTIIRPGSSQSFVSDFSKLSVDELGLFDEEEGFEFDWDNCQLDQMFVFDDVDHIVSVAVHELRPTNTITLQKPIAAAIIFLCARYAHYFNSSDLLDSLLTKSHEQIVKLIQDNTDDNRLLAYWISNATQLLYYLKRDPGLLLATFDTQAALSELIHETSFLLIRDVTRKLHGLVKEALLDQTPIEGMENVRFESSFRFTKPKRTLLLTTIPSGSPPHSPTTSQSLASTSPTVEPKTTETNGSDTTMSRTKNGSPPQPRTALPPRSPKPGIRSAAYQQRSSFFPQRIFSRRWPYKVSPKTITTIFNSTLFLLQSCMVHREIVHQIFSQLFLFLGAELFNMVITNRNYCSRTKALQIRMNMCAIEDWIKDHQREFPPRTVNLSNHIKPFIHLLQFLQVISSVRDLAAFVETMARLDGITMAQVRLAMAFIALFRWEVDEETFPEEVQLYVQQVLEDLVRWHNSNGDTIAGIEGSDDTLQRQQQTSSSVPSVGNLSRESSSSDEIDAFSELLDPNPLFSFHVPVILNGDALVDETWPGAALSPVIPEEIMKKLDRKADDEDDATNERALSPTSATKPPPPKSNRSTVLGIFGWKAAPPPPVVAVTARSRSPSSPLRNITNASDFSPELMDEHTFGDTVYQNC